MKRINYKGRCEKRKVSKCTEVCRTYSKIQSAYVDVLEQDEGIISFECNVLLEGIEGNQYSSDFVAIKTDGSTIIRECVWRFNLNTWMLGDELEGEHERLFCPYTFDQWIAMGRPKDDMDNDYMDIRDFMLTIDRNINLLYTTDQIP